MKESKVTARTAAALSVLKVMTKGAFSNLEISAALTRNNFNAKDAAFYTMLTHGTIERLRTLDFFIDTLADGGIEKIDEKTKSILRVGAYQLLFTDKIPARAACDEAVKTAGYMGIKSGGFVNALMRRGAREADLFLKDIGNLPPAVRYSLSDSVYDLLCGQYDDIEKILEASFEIAPLVLRVNTQKTDLSAVLAALPEAERLSHSDFGVRCNESAGAVLERLGAGVFIQGEGSQYTAALLAPKSGQRVIDVCACPGGKSFSAALMMGNEGEVISLDLHQNKLSLIEKGASRLGIDIIKTAQNDARTAIAGLVGTADGVICDVPCSGLGEMMTKPEIRYKDAADFERLTQIQFEILSESIKYLKPQGKIVYSTCTINKNENEGVVSRFLGANPDFRIEEQKVFNFERDGEGFYACKLSR